MGGDRHGDGQRERMVDQAGRPPSEPAPPRSLRVEPAPTVPPPRPHFGELPPPTGMPVAAPLPPGVEVADRRRRTVLLLSVTLVVGAALLGGAAAGGLLAGWWEPPGRVASLDDPEVPAGKVTVGAVEAAEGEHPAVVAVARADEPDAFLGQECGGTAVASRWVLTAAHCVEDAPDALVVHAGSVDLTSPALQTHRVVEVVLHPRWEPHDPGLAGDLALLRLDTDLSVPPLRLAGSDRFRAHGVEARLLGWGGLAHDERRQVYPEVLVELALPTVDDDRCAAALGRDHRPGAHFCAGAPAQDGGADACRGDSGGPLVVADPDGWVQIGIVSFGETCGMTYTAYTDVAAACSFVAETVAVTSPEELCVP